MFEGKELEKDLGGFGKATLDVSDKGIVKADVGAFHPSLPGSKAGAFIELDIIEVLEVLAKRTTNGVDDGVVSMVKMALGRS